jgi:hypothetical protein
VTTLREGGAAAAADAEAPQGRAVGAAGWKGAPERHVNRH